MLNRANARMPIFTKDEDFIAFETVLQEAVARTGTRLLSYCLMANHWHLVLWPQEDDELSWFVGWRTHQVLPSLYSTQGLNRPALSPAGRCASH